MKNIFRQSAFFAFFAVGVSMWFYLGIVSKARTEKSSNFDAAAVYKKNCASCHGKDGQAKSLRGKLTGAQNLTDGEWQNETSDKHIFNVIVDGRKKMPAFGKKLSEADINSLVAYIRGLKR